jgi:nucleotide-binding universal stress UspA family protein
VQFLPFPLALGARGAAAVGTTLAVVLGMTTTGIQKLLVPVDFSSCSRAALALACKLGAALGAALDVIFVRSGSGEEPADQSAVEEELRRFVQTVPESTGLTIRRDITTGDPRERIVTLAETGGYDLIILGTHGRTGRARSLAGSVAESVVRTATRPVVTVRET